MYKDLIPEIHIEIAYKDRASGEIVIVNDTITPLKRFPMAKFEKLYEIGTLKVSMCNCCQYIANLMCVLILPP